MNTRQTLIKATEILRGDTSRYTAVTFEVDNHSFEGRLIVTTEYQLYREDLGHSIRVDRLSEVIPLAKQMIK